MGAAVIPYAFAGRIGIDFGILDLLILIFCLILGILEGLDLPFWALSIFAPGVSGDLVVCAELGPWDLSSCLWTS
jgi:hypothetical protein